MRKVKHIVLDFTHVGVLYHNGVGRFGIQAMSGEREGVVIFGLILCTLPIASYGEKYSSKPKLL